MTCLEDLVSAIRSLPASPALSLNAALVVRYCVANGPTRISELAGQLGVSQPAATQIIDRLAADGWVRRTADSHDRRAVLVAATAEGRRRYARRHQSRVDALHRELDGLTRTQLDGLAAAMPTLAQLVAAMADPVRKASA